MSNQCVEMNSIKDRLICRRPFQHFSFARCFANFLEYFHVVMTQVLKSFAYKVVPPTHVQLTKTHVTDITYSTRLTLSMTYIFILVLKMS